MKPTRERSGLFNLLGLVVAWVVVFAVFSYFVPDSFPTLRNFETLARQGTIVSIAALGMTYIIISGGIDLSVGSMMAFVAVVIAAVLQAGQPPLVAMGAGIAAGGLCGLVNGLIITKLKVVPFIVTLGTLLILRGAAKGIAREQKIDAPMTWLNDLLAVLGKEDRWKILPIGVWLMIVLAVLVAFVLNNTRFGRHVVAVGSNETAARFSGIDVDRVKLWVYTLGGLFAGVSGLMLFSRLTVGDPTAAAGAELDVIAAVVIGGASLTGGEGSVAGTVLGALIMTTIRSGCSQMGLPNWVQEIVTGAIIVLAVWLDRMRVRRAAASSG